MQGLQLFGQASARMRDLWNSLLLILRLKNVTQNIKTTPNHQNRNQTCKNDSKRLTPLNKFLARIYAKIEIQCPETNRMMDVQSYLHFLAERASLNRQNSHNLPFEVF